MSSTKVRLRCAVASDLDAILALDGSTEEVPHWSRRIYEDILASMGGASAVRCVFVAQVADAADEELAGFAVGCAHPSSSQRDLVACNGDDHCIAELESVAVAASARRCGIGRALCEAVVEWSRSRGAKQIQLEVRARSVAPVALYSSLGFEVAGRRPQYYCEPQDDALLMSLDLD
jgi:ribosomal-protein-alanine N-acetyltransferase